MKLSDRSSLEREIHSGESAPARLISFDFDGQLLFDVEMNEEGFFARPSPREQRRLDAVKVHEIRSKIEPRGIPTSEMECVPECVRYASSGIGFLLDKQRQEPYLAPVQVAVTPLTSLVACPARTDHADVKLTRRVFDL